ncbi:MAG: hypothetical protein AAFP90_07300 [Planctomycetota bacterium]
MTEHSDDRNTSTALPGAGLLRRVGLPLTITWLIATVLSVLLSFLAGFDVLPVTMLLVVGAGSAFVALFGLLPYVFISGMDGGAVLVRMVASMGLRLLGTVILGGACCMVYRNVIVATLLTVLAWYVLMSLVELITLTRSLASGPGRDDCNPDDSTAMEVIAC